MAKRRMKLPNGFGSIKYLGSGRRKPYAVYPPAEGWAESGKYQVTPKALSYEETWEDAYEILTAYNMEKKGKIRVNRNVMIDRTPTFSEVYENYYHEKYFGSPKKLSKASMTSTKAAFKNCSSIHGMQMGQIRYDDLQGVINNCKLKHSSLELIVSLMHQMYQYAMKYEIIEKDYSAFLYIPIEDDDESGVPFSDEELEMAYFRGGVKTKFGKNRIVPIHSKIFPLVHDRMEQFGCMLPNTAQFFRVSMYKKLEDAGMQKHTPHDCRHTFSVLCEKYGVNENDRKRMMGHSFGNDITNQKYSHRTVDELRKEIEKIIVCY